MRYLLDTNAVIHAIRGRPAKIRQRVDAMGPATITVSAVTVAELWFGAEKSSDPDKRRRVFAAFLQPFDILPFDEAAGKEHGVLRHRLRRSPIGERDLLIAAIARSLHLTVVTENTGEFRRVPGLSVEDWTG